jgi:hypothetical protein
VGHEPDDDGGSVTHRERATLAAAEIMHMPAQMEAKVEGSVEEIVWKAIVEGCGEEVARKAEIVEQRNKAWRMQRALELRNAQLEQWLEDLRNVLGLVDGVPTPTPTPAELLRVRMILDEFQVELDECEAQ